MCVARELGSQAFRPEVGGVGEALRGVKKPHPLAAWNSEIEVIQSTPAR